MEREKRVRRVRRTRKTAEAPAKSSKEFTRQEWIDMMSEAYYQAQKRLQADET